MIDELVGHDEPAIANPVRARWHLVTLLAVVALVAGAVAIAGGPGVARPAKVGNAVQHETKAFDGAGSAVGQLAGFGASPVHAQIGGGFVSAIVCPILNALASVFGPFLGPIVNTLRVFFGCTSA